MTYKNVKEVITASGLDPLITYSDNGMSFVPVDDKAWDNNIFDSRGLTVKGLSKTIQIPPAVYAKPGQIEVFKSNLIHELALEVIKSIFVETNTIGADAMVPIYENATKEHTLGARAALAAYDELIAASPLDGMTIFNSEKAVDFSFTQATNNDIYDAKAPMPNTELIALSAVKGSYMLFLEDVNFEVKKLLNVNKIMLTGEILVQGMPTMPVIAVEVE